MKKTLILAGVWLLPLVLFAQSGNDAEDVVDVIFSIVKGLAGIAILLAFFYFLWGIAEFIRKLGKGDPAEEAKNRIMWGIVALFVMFSFLGIITILQNTFGTQGGVDTFLDLDIIRGGSSGQETKSYSQSLYGGTPI